MHFDPNFMCVCVCVGVGGGWAGLVGQLVRRCFVSILSISTTDPACVYSSFFIICRCQHYRANIGTESPPKTNDQGNYTVATESVENDKD